MKVVVFLRKFYSSLTQKLQKMQKGDTQFNILPTSSITNVLTFTSPRDVVDTSGIILLGGALEDHGVSEICVDIRRSNQQLSALYPT